MSQIKFKYTILYVKDVAKTVAFYEQAFDLTCKFIAPENAYAEMLSGETTLSFCHHDLAGSNLSKGYQKSDLSQQTFGIEIGFTTDDVPATVKKALDAGATLLEEAKTKPWGQVVAYVRDLDGFLVEICTEM